jgi:predicted regulator of amino acid metabolism with ACT domain
LEANHRTGRYEAVQTELAKAINKSRRIVGKYIEELQRKHGLHRPAQQSV